MRLIDADAFDRWLTSAEFYAALNKADDDNRAFENQTMLYSTQSFRDVMANRPTIYAIPVEWIVNLKNEYAREGHEQAEGDLINLILMWHKEQEANNA